MILMMTPIDWLKSQLENYGDPQYCEITWDELDVLINQAKEMEKEQIKDAYEKGHDNGEKMEFGYRFIDFVEYYNELYGK